MTVNRILYVAFLLLLIGCAKNSPEQRLKSFMNDPGNKIVQRITVGDVGVVTKYLPTQYRALMQRQRNPSEPFNDEYEYFDVVFDRNTTGKLASEKSLYLNFDIQNDFVLFVNNRDSVAPSICQRIENGISNSFEYLVGFDNSNKDWKAFTLFYHDKIFNVGTLAFVYNEKELRQIPQLNEKTEK